MKFQLPRFPLLAALLAGALLSSGISGCALMKRADTPIAIGLLPAAADDWPAGIEPGRVAADAGLRSDRIVVMQGAIRMQHEGLRWIDAPAVLLAEQLRQRRARAGGDFDPVAARLDLQLTAFQLRLDQGPRRVEVAASAMLVCEPGGTSRYLAPVAIAVDVPAQDTATLAAAFADATGSLLGQVLAQASTQRIACAGEPTPPSAGD